MIGFIALGVAAATGIAWVANKLNVFGATAGVPVVKGVVMAATVDVKSDNLNAFTDLGSNPDSWPIVELNGERWQVSPSYVGPIGINEAAELARRLGLKLPSPALVDAIWRAADLKVLPMPRNNVVSQAVFDDQRRRIEAQVDGRGFTILGGIFKDVVDVNGHPQIYGWHVEDGKIVPGIPLLKTFTPGPGKVIQPLSGGVHDSPGPIGFKDYSQGARLVRKVG